MKIKIDKKNKIEYIVPVYLIKKYSGLLCLYSFKPNLGAYHNSCHNFHCTFYQYSCHNYCHYSR